MALALACGVAIGAALVFLLDPDRGRRRRAVLRDKSLHYARIARERQQGRLRHAAHRAQGAIAALRSTVQPEEIVEDDILIERVRAALGHVVRDPRTVDVRARCGIVILKGPVREDQIGEMVACVQRVRGVLGVDNRMSINYESGEGAAGTAPDATGTSYPDGIAR